MTNIEQKIEKALHDDNIVKIMHKASYSFRKQLDQDTIDSCHLYALWKCFLNFKPEKNVKFTTYLFKGVTIECIKQLKFLKKQSKANGMLHDNITTGTKENLLFEILDEAKNDYEKELIMDKYKNMTIVEMATKRNSNRETIRKQLKNIFNRIAKKHTM